MVTEQAMRSKLNYLEKNGFITMGRGKVGTQLTEKGKQLISKKEIYYAYSACDLNGQQLGRIY
ncbi:hypothetical protein G9F72_010965 [Clostridium estertheticum]|nr:hypothetical protein [Clostridium estertheticum]